MTDLGQRTVRRRHYVFTADMISVDGKNHRASESGTLGLVLPRDRTWGGVVDLTEIGTVNVMSASFRPGRVVFQARAQEDGRIYLIRVNAGSMTLRPTAGTGTEPVTLREGELYLGRSTLEYEVQWRDQASLSITTVPLHLVEEFGLPEDRVDGPVQEASALTAPTLGFLENLAAGQGTMTALDAYFLDKLTNQMMGALLLAQRGLGPAAGAAQPRLYDRALSLMTAQRADADVTPERIAAQMNVSLRNLQRDFSRNGTSVAATLRRLRAELAVQLLTDPQYDVLSIPQIALYSGFSSSSLLRRALGSLGWGTPASIRQNR